jgi:hypothetical protein
MTGCAYADKQQRAEAIIKSVQLLEEAKTAKGHLSLSLRLANVAAASATSKSPTSKPPTSKPPANRDLATQAAFSPAPNPIDVDFARMRAAATPAPQAAVAPASAGNVAATEATARFLAANVGAVWNHGMVYVERPAANAANDIDQRPWVQLDFRLVSKRAESELQQVPAVNIVNPTYLVSLLGGTLSGSVKKLGVEQVAGVPTVKYEMNIDRDKASRALEDKDRQSLENTFASNHFTGTIYKRAQVWIDTNGLPRKIVLPVKQSITLNGVRSTFDVKVTIEFTEFGAPVQITVPGPNDTARVSSLNALYAAVRS